MKEKIIAIIRWRDADGRGIIDAALAAAAFFYGMWFLMSHGGH